MKRIIALAILALSLPLQAQLTNRYYANEYTFYVQPSTNFNGFTVRVTPAGFSLFGRIFLNAEIRRPGNAIIDRQIVVLGTNAVRLFAISTNRPALIRTLVLNQISLDANPAAIDEPVNED